MPTMDPLLDRKEFIRRTNKQPRGKLVIIGGHEDKSDGCDILSMVADIAKKSGKSLIIMTSATEVPEELGEEYTQVFKRLGVKHIDVLHQGTRADSFNQAKIELLKKAGVIFFTGGDQLRITSQIGDSLLYRYMSVLYHDGATIVGTSAGAAAMSETMLISGTGDETVKIAELGMAPGLALAKEMVIDTHFAQRGRMGRLITAVSQNPRMLGIGIDENTAIIYEQDNMLTVIGTGAVYILDGADMAYSSVSDLSVSDAEVISLFNVKLHVLTRDYRYDLQARLPITPVGNRSGHAIHVAGKAQPMNGHRNGNGHGSGKHAKPLR